MRSTMKAASSMARATKNLFTIFGLLGPHLGLQAGETIFILPWSILQRELCTFNDL